MKTITTIVLSLSAFMLSSGNTVFGADETNAENTVQTPVDILKLIDSQKNEMNSENTAQTPVDILKLVDSKKDEANDENAVQTSEEKKEVLLTRKAASHKFKWEKSFRKAQSIAKTTGLPIAVLFTGTSWCGYCVKLEKEVLSKSSFSKEMKGVVIGYKSVIDSSFRPENTKDRQLIQKYPCNGAPCLYIISPSGEVMDKLSGYMPYDSYVAWIKKAAASAKN